MILGHAQLAGTAEIDGSFVVVGGTGVIAEGARVHEDVFALGGLDAAPGFSPGGNHVAIGTASLGARLTALVPWLTRGLVFGRLIVPDLGWVWTVAIVFFLLNLLLNLLFDAPVRACAAALRATPVSAFLTGLLVMLLAGPLCLLLAISVVGIAVDPVRHRRPAARRHRRTDWICAVAGHDASCTRRISRAGRSRCARS